MGDTPLWKLPAHEVVELLREGKVNPLELIDAAEARWRETDPAINAIPITCWELARQEAAALAARGHPDPPPRGYLYGLPIVVKDVTEVKGVRYTQGCMLFADRIGTKDDPLVQVLKDKGAIVVGKSNTPEFAAGSQTFNAVFGVTRNPWDTSKTAGGSSGGSTAALAAGSAWLATGSDLGGSLRNPAAYCGIYGLRPAVGRVPQAYVPPPAPECWRLQSVSGPLARTVADLALLLDAMAEQHPDDPLTRPPPPLAYSEAIAPGALPPPQRVAWSADLGGIVPVHPELAAACRAAAEWFAGEPVSAQVVQAQPDLQGAQEVFQTLRAAAFKVGLSLLQEPLRSAIKPDLRWQLEQAAGLTPEQLAAAVSRHDEMLASMRAFFQQHDLLLVPATLLPPFDAAVPWPRECQGVQFSTYIDWLAIASAISLLDCPAVSVPCSFTANGLPIGIQFVGRSEEAVLAAAALWEASHPPPAPIDPRTPAAGPPE